MRANQLLYGIAISSFSIANSSATVKKEFHELKAKPNVIIILTDDQGYGELSANGNPILKTPNLDLLRSQSIRLEDFHAAPMSTPTRGQLLTGRDACRNGAVNVSSGRAVLKLGFPTMSEIFLANGYSTGIFGKWHLGDNYPFRPEDRGFQETLWFPSSHIGSIPDYWGNDYIDDVYIQNGERKQFTGYCTDVFFNNAIDWIKRCKSLNKPSFTYIATNAAHEPYNALPSDVAVIEKNSQNFQFPENGKSKRTNIVKYLAMIRNIDTNVGKLLKFLKKEKLEKNTILIFLTDNGGTFGPDYYEAGMRGRKTELYEGGHRVPFFIRFPNGSGFDKPRDIFGLTQTQDILPTLLDLCKIEKNRYKFDGMSLAAVLEGNNSVPERILFVNYSRMPYFFNYPSPYSNSILKKSDTGVMWKQWRYLNQTELYDLATDPMQKKNVIADFPAIVNKLDSDLDIWWNQISEDANKPVRQPIGFNNKTLKLTACEWLDVFMDQQSQVIKGEQKNSYWLLDVVQSGTYELELRRYPKESKLNLSSKINAGSAFAVNAARVCISEDNKVINLRKSINSEDESVTFIIDLNKGNVTLHTWFDDTAGTPIAGAYYVYVTRKLK